MRAHVPCSVAAVLVVAASGCGGRAVDTVAVPRSVVIAAAASTPSAALGTAGTVAEITAGAPPTASTTALRVTGPRPATACQQIAFSVGLRTASRQVIVVRTASSTATTAVLQVATQTVGGWSCSVALSARVGRNGVRPLLERRSGDGTTPAGVFPLATMTAWDGQRFSFFGNSADPGVSAGQFRAVRSGDCFGATPFDPDYGHLVFRTAADCPGPDDEYLPRFGGVYSYAALIGANMEPGVSGDAPGETPYAAAIFLHRHSYDSSGATRPTSGCVSLSSTDLVAVLRTMQRGVVFAIGTESWLLNSSW